VFDRPDPGGVVAGRNTEPADLALSLERVDRACPVARLQDADARTVQHVHVDAVASEPSQLAVNVVQDGCRGEVAHGLGAADYVVDGVANLGGDHGWSRPLAGD